MTPADGVRVVLVAASLGGGLGLLAWAGGRLGWAPETRRKAAHIGLGLGCAAFPWIFSSPAQVWVLAAFATLGLIALRGQVARSSTLGSALHGVARRSWGDVVFPLAVALVFHASGGRWELHVAPILVLTLADAAGALAGSRWGRHPLRMEGMQRKSVEGSCAVFAVAVPCVALPLALGAGWPWTLALAVALLAALLAALIEGVALDGLDNLFLPLLTLAVLTRAEGWTSEGVLLRLGLLVVIVGTLAYLGRRLTPLSDAGLMGLALALYLFASLGGLPWLAGPFALALWYLFLHARAPDRATRRHPLAAVVAVSAAPLAWLACAPSVAIQPAAGAFVAQGFVMLVAERGYFIDREHPLRWIAQAGLGALASIVAYVIPL